MSQIDQIREYILADNVEDAVELFFSLIRKLPQKYKNELTLHTSSWKNLKDVDRKGLLTRDEFLRESRRIKSAILDFLVDVEEIYTTRETLNSTLPPEPEIRAEHRKLRVFLCHASQDKPAVRELYQKLIAESWIEPWLDEEKLLPGQNWNLEIEKAVESSDAVIVCISSTSIAKEGYVQKEIRQVLKVAMEKLEGAIFVLPVKLDDCDLPRQLKDWQAVDYFPVFRQAAAYEKLKAALGIRKDHLGI